jgi:hypothetical protein
MTTGALIFAFDNESTDYVAMASWSARNIRRWLNIPTAVVTDAPPEDPRLRGFDQVISAEPESGGTRWFEDYAATVTWHNAGRTDAYALSPWDQTLVLDADYVVASGQLKAVLDSNQEFLAHAAAYDITGTNNFAGLNDYGEYKMPMSWATVMMFRRSEHAELIFDCMRMIRANWRHYKDLYQIVSSTYRNDHALSIALNIVNGQTLQHTSILWSLASVTPEHTLTRTSLDCYRIDYQDQEKRPRWTMIKNQDFHAMGKHHLEKIIETD